MARTDSKIDTPLAQPGSLDVHALPEMIAALTAMRARYGAESPEGHHCTNLIEQLSVLTTWVRPEWAMHEWHTLPYQIKQQIKGLAELTAA